MVAKGRGGGKTPTRLVELVNKAIAEKSLRSISRETGLGLAPISRYSKGTSEPSLATLEKLADYFRVSVAYLRGENELFGQLPSNWEIENMWLRMLESEFLLLANLSQEEKTVLCSIGKYESFYDEIDLNKILTSASKIINISENDATRLDTQYLKSVQNLAQSVLDKYFDPSSGIVPDPEVIKKKQTAT